MPMAGTGGEDDKQQSLGSTEYQLKKYLLLLATLVATVTYAAGLNLPGGSWLEDSPGGRTAGDSILRETNYRRYIVFYYFNAIAFAASLLLSLLLLLLQKDGGNNYLLLMWAVMLVDGLGLMGAYAAGGSHDRFTTVCAAVLASGVSLYAVVAFLIYFVSHPPDLRLRRGTEAGAGGARRPPAARELGKKHEILLVLAIFAATIAYVAGLNPPGGFWRQEGHRAAGYPVLQGTHPRRYKAFFFCNTTAFNASLLAIMLIVDHEKLDLEGRIERRVVALYGLIITALLGLGGAYAAGSCRDSKHSAYVLLLLLPVAACIYLQKALVRVWRRMTTNKLLPCTKEGPQGCCGSFIKLFQNSKIASYICAVGMGGTSEDLKRTREYIQLLATLVATIAYQAGLDPPGGVWASNGEGHSVGDPILLTINPGRYKVFFYFNSAAFVASIVIVIMLQNEHLVRGHALEVALILDFFGLIGAYAAGSCRNTTTSIYTVALAGGVLIYVVIHIVFFTLDHGEDTGEKKDKYESHRVVLLLLAILAATLTYQAGLTPPGGFWEEDDSELGHRAGFPVLQDKYPRRYEAFFYCNTASFMASVALIVLLLNPNLYRPGIRCYALVVCMVAGVLGLLGAYAAGSSLHLRTSIIFLVLVVVGFAIVVGLAIHRHCVPPPPVTTNTTTATKVPEPNSGDPAPPNNVLEKQERPVTTTTTTKVAEPNSGDPAPPNNVLEKQERSMTTTTTTKVSESNSSDPAPPNNMLEKQERLVTTTTTTKVPEPNSGNLAPPNNVLEKQERPVTTTTTTTTKVPEPNSGDPAPSNNVLEKQERPVTTTTKVPEPNSGDPAPPNNVLEIQVRSVTITTTTTKVPEPNSSHPAPPNNSAEETAMYLMLVGILAASVTYLTGLKPPGGMWRGDGNGHSAGNPVLYDTNKLRYNVFFYSNSISFIASVVVITLLLLRMMLSPATAMVIGPIHAAMVLDMLFLLVAYAAGSVRDSHRSWKVIMIFPAVVLVVFFFFFVSRKQTVSRNQTEKAEESTVDGGEKGECKGPHSIRIIQL